MKSYSNDIPDDSAHKQRFDRLVQLIGLNLIISLTTLVLVAANHVS